MNFSTYYLCFLLGRLGRIRLCLLSFCPYCELRIFVFIVRKKKLFHSTCIDKDISSKLVQIHVGPHRIDVCVLNRRLFIRVGDIVSFQFQVMIF